MRCAALLLAGIVAACGSPDGSRPPEPSVDEWPPATPARELPPVTGEYVADPDAPEGVWRVRPVSARIEHGVAYAFTLGHCGLGSPIDLDGSFWDPLEADDRVGGPIDLDANTELINATSGSVAVVGDEARFRTESGTVVRMARHDGPKDHGLCR